MLAPFVAVLLLATPADAADKARAAAAFKLGQASFAAGDYTAALANFQETYSLVPSDELLFDIGLCHRHLKQWAQARDYFQRYLADPTAPKRAKVEVYLAEANAQLASIAPSNPEQLAPAPPPPVLVGTPPQAAATVPSAATEASPEQKPEPRGHTAAYVFGGIAAVGLAGAVAGFANVGWFNYAYAPTTATYVQAHATATNWAIAGWISTAVALACGTTAAVEW